MLRCHRSWIFSLHALRWIHPKQPHHTPWSATASRSQSLSWGAHCRLQTWGRLLDPMLSPVVYWRTVQISWLESSRGFSTSPWPSRLSHPAWSPPPSSPCLRDFASPASTTCQSLSHRWWWNALKNLSGIASLLTKSHDPHPFADRANRSTEDAIAVAHCPTWSIRGTTY